jgi:magnesium transporter
MINQIKVESAEEKAKHMFVYLSYLIDRPVFDKIGQEVGKLYDIIVQPSAVYPQSSHMIIRKGFPDRKYAVIKWQDIEEMDAKDIRLKIDKAAVHFVGIHNNKQELTLRRDILDQQVVDIYNHKVIRVNDIHLLFVDHCLMLAHVDISTRGLIRRLGVENIMDFLVGLFNKNADYLTKEHLISWKHIQPLSINPASMTIKVDVAQKHLHNIPAADLGEIFLDLNHKDQAVLFKSLDLKTKSRIFINIDFKTQKSLVGELSTGEIVEILNNIPSDEATDFLEKLPQDTTHEILSLMESKQSKKFSQLLGYSSDSAGGLMTAEYIAFVKDTTVESVLSQIKQRTFKAEPAQFVYIVDGQNHLIGTTNFRHLILAAPQELIQNLVFSKTYFVRLNSSVKEVAYLMEKYKYYAIPVVDDDNVLHGIITVDDILSQLVSFAWRRLKKIRVITKQQ